MQLPYTNDYPEAVSVAGQVLGATFAMVVWLRPLRTRSATVLFSAAICLAALLPLVKPSLAAWSPDVTLLRVLQGSALLAMFAMLKQRPVGLKALAVLGEAGLLWLTLNVRESDYELIFAHLFWYGLLYGVYLSRAAAPSPHWCPNTGSHTFPRHDAAIFAITVALAFLATNLLFKHQIFNGDEVANSFQANVYAHFQAYAPIPPCASMFENYWVFRHAGRAFSQYTPGWPLFMALFDRFGAISLAGPVMAGVLAIAIARLSRRLAAGLGGEQNSRRIVGAAGLLGPLFAMLGPSLLMNGASRFSHTMVCACFAWGVESLCVLSERGVSRHRALRYGLVLGAATSLGLATRPADGAMLGVGVFLYFLRAAYDRRISWRSFLGTTISFAVFGGLTLVLLRLQIGEWFKTGYDVAPSFHAEAKLRLSWPKLNELKYSFPFATGSYCWWPAAPALGIAGLVRALAGRERRVAFMLLASGCAQAGFYAWVEFGRGGDDGLGPRYLLPLVLLMATGMAALLAPLFALVSVDPRVRIISWLRSQVPIAVMSVAILYGVVQIAPLVYPVARAEYKYATAPLRGAEKQELKNAIVMIIPGHATQHETNLAQNSPMNLNPDVLFLIRRNAADEVCARKNFPGRTWYRAGLNETLAPF